MSPAAQTEAADQGSARDHEQSTCAATPDGAAKGFTLDTSGSVRLPRSPQSVIRNHLWSDLSPFEQGFLARFLEATGSAFSDIHPTALAAILKDCAAMLGRMQTVGPAFHETKALGARAWEEQQAGNWPSFPPLTIKLGDDGKVHLMGAA